ncbi:MAG: pantoate--beta-alanine ligase [Beijerinckiaceae bacterium]|nr:pantoate--beta-alanine ligase [Beijerinckiaceae bacterium]
MSAPVIVRTIAELRRTTAPWRRAGERVALVPTMGALHAGHVSLVALARTKAQRVAASIFVNPSQFAPTEDFDKYPRTFEADVEKLAAAGCSLVFAPAAAEMYPPGFATTISLEGPAKAGLEDAVRPTHFSGVATIVAKLLIQAAPDVAVFGEKDYQQLAVIRTMARDLDLPVEIIGAPTLREADGLAMSSRNIYLSPAERAAAPALYAAMQACAAKLAKGEAFGPVLAAGRAHIEQAGFALDYLELRDAVTLAPAAPGATGEMRLLAAGRIGSTRLIDNIAIHIAPAPGAGSIRQES